MVSAIISFIVVLSFCLGIFLGVQLKKEKAEEIYKEKKSDNKLTLSEQLENILTYGGDR